MRKNKSKKIGAARDPKDDSDTQGLPQPSREPSSKYQAQASAIRALKSSKESHPGAPEVKPTTYAKMGLLREGGKVSGELSRALRSTKIITEEVDRQLKKATPEEKKKFKKTRRIGGLSRQAVG